jgi:hypothetical protein
VGSLQRPVHTRTQQEEVLRFVQSIVFDKCRSEDAERRISTKMQSVGANGDQPRTIAVGINLTSFLFLHCLQAYEIQKPTSQL